MLHAAIKRIAALHDGKIPPEAAAAWKSAMDIGRERQRARQRELSLCGPECLAELIGRGIAGRRPAAGGPGHPVHDLAAELHTDERGTTLAELAAAARRRGLRSAGMELTLAGLTKQRLPLIALINPHHYVLVERVDGGQVRIWDPDGKGAGNPARRSYSLAEWVRAWNGVALVLS